MQILLRRDSPDSECIVRAENLGTVQEDLSRGIETVEDQIDIGAGKQCGCYIKSVAILPARILDPLQLRFVIAIEGVFDLLVREQVEMHVAGNGRGQPSSLGILCGRGDLAKLPAVIENNAGILCSCGLGARERGKA